MVFEVAIQGIAEAIITMVIIVAVELAGFGDSQACWWGQPLRQLQCSHLQEWSTPFRLPQCTRPR